MVADGLAVPLQVAVKPFPAVPMMEPPVCARTVPVVGTAFPPPSWKTPEPVATMGLPPAPPAKDVEPTKVAIEPLANGQIPAAPLAPPPGLIAHPVQRNLAPAVVSL